MQEYLQGAAGDVVVPVLDASTGLQRSTLTVASVAARLFKNGVGSDLTPVASGGGTGSDRDLVKDRDGVWLLSLIAADFDTPGRLDVMVAYDAEMAPVLLRFEVRNDALRKTVQRFSGKVTWNASTKVLTAYAEDGITPLQQWEQVEVDPVTMAIQPI